MQLESGKIVAIKTAIKAKEKHDETGMDPTKALKLPSLPILPPSIKDSNYRLLTTKLLLSNCSSSDDEHPHPQLHPHLPPLSSEKAKHPLMPGKPPPGAVSPAASAASSADDEIQKRISLLKKNISIQRDTLDSITSAFQATADDRFEDDEEDEEDVSETSEAEPGAELVEDEEEEELDGVEAGGQAPRPSPAERGSERPQRRRDVRVRPERLRCRRRWRSTIPDATQRDTSGERRGWRRVGRRPRVRRPYNYNYGYNVPYHGHPPPPGYGYPTPAAATSQQQQQPQQHPPPYDMMGGYGHPPSQPPHAPPPHQYGYGYGAYPPPQQQPPPHYPPPPPPPVSAYDYNAAPPPTPQPMYPPPSYHSPYRRPPPRNMRKVVCTRRPLRAPPQRTQGTTSTTISKRHNRRSSRKDSSNNSTTRVLKGESSRAMVEFIIIVLKRKRFRDVLNVQLYYQHDPHGKRKEHFFSSKLWCTK
nr:unnamed protein product [Callosobruchus chinensis]